MHTTGGISVAKDFSQGSMTGNILRQAIPLACAQLVHMLYNIVDRIYIGHMPDTGTLALTGIGITLPVISFISACTNLIGSGAVPIFSIARGAGDNQQADRAMGNAFLLLLTGSLVLMLVIYPAAPYILPFFGASSVSFPFAQRYLSIYLAGTPFAMLSTGLNGFINAQGFPGIGMMTTILGAVLNLALDPLLIYTFGFGLEGAAWATVFSQFVSCSWVLWFLFRGKKLAFHLHSSAIKPDRALDRKIVSLGVSGFMMQATNGIVQAATTSQLQLYGQELMGDLYVSVYTVICSVRELVSMPISGLTSGAQPVIGFNYGARLFKRVREGIRIMSRIGLVYTLAMWLLILLRPDWFITLFSSDAALLDAGVTSVRQFFAAFIFMTLQFAGQSVFQGLGYARNAVFFSLLRKVFIVLPLVFILPRLGLGLSGVFLAEPVSDVLGGSACYLTMFFTVYRPMKQIPDGRSVVHHGFHKLREDIR